MRQNFIYFNFLILSLFINVNFIFGQVQEKTRLFVLTDIENEPDDAQSLVRLLTYANHFEIEGLVATTSNWMRNEVADWRIHEIVEAYGKVSNNLEVHEKGYPTANTLKKVIKKGRSEFGMVGVGKDKDTEGSDWLIAAIEKDDVRPLWITAWGGTNVLAQALYKLERTKSSEDLKRLLSKIRVYAISDQDDSGPWIRNNFKDVFYIVSPGYEENGGGQYHYATWSGISGDKFHGRFNGPDFTLVDNPWLDKNIRINHGPLGAEHPHTEYLMEGDTPSFLGLIQNGLNNLEHPDYGSWGGRYELYIPQFKKYMYEPELRPIWTNTEDEVFSDVTNRRHTSQHATIWRWRYAYQNDFAARIDWSNTDDYNKVNHPPIVKLAHANNLTVKPGETVNLNGSLTTDPDGDKLQFNWFTYREPGTLNGHLIQLDVSEDGKSATFKAPKVEKSKTTHIILEVTDNGVPALTRYQRVIVSIIAK
ncbi:DUF1593 domain-containing protein [Kriegella sp. EG-1]|nr:DUF1593 domain-containing protein [Flavobacteriaceae bacterium EG-1]